MVITTPELTLKPEIVQEIRSNQDLKNRLQLEMHISHPTLYRWLKSNSKKFTTATALRTISEVLGRPYDDLLTEAA